MYFAPLIKFDRGLKQILLHGTSLRRRRIRRIGVETWVNNVPSKLVVLKSFFTAVKHTLYYL